MGIANTVCGCCPGGGGGGGTVTLPGCSCTSTPTTLYLTSSGPCYTGDFQACTFVWGPTPTQFAGLGLGANCFLSTVDFQDPTQTPPFGLFRYVLSCAANFFNLSRVYEPNIYNSAYYDAISYTWNTTVSGNTCSPFLLTVGTIYAGGNPSCIVVISQ